MGFNLSSPSGTIRLLIAVVAGIGTLGYGAYSYTQQTSALDTATPVDATIESTDVETVSQRRGVEYRPRATFTYTYQGETYTSSNVYPGALPREFGSEETARSELDGFQSGDTVTAYVKPDDPGNAFLKHESSNKPFIVMGIGALVVIGTIVSKIRS